MFQKYNSLAIIVICTMFLFVACSKSDTELKNIQKVRLPRILFKCNESRWLHYMHMVRKEMRLVK